MATYQIKSPQGETYEITAPDTATEGEVLAYAQKNFSKAPDLSVNFGGKVNLSAMRDEVPTAFMGESKGKRPLAAPKGSAPGSRIGELAPSGRHRLVKEATLEDIMAEGFAQKAGRYDENVDRWDYYLNEPREGVAEMLAAPLDIPFSVAQGLQDMVAGQSLPNSRGTFRTGVVPRLEGAKEAETFGQMGGRAIGADPGMRPPDAQAEFFGRVLKEVGAAAPTAPLFMLSNAGRAARAFVEARDGYRTARAALLNAQEAARAVKSAEIARSPAGQAVTSFMAKEGAEKLKQFTPDIEVAMKGVEDAKKALQVAGQAVRAAGPEALDMVAKTAVGSGIGAATMGQIAPDSLGAEVSGQVAGAVLPGYAKISPFTRTAKAIISKDYREKVATDPMVKDWMQQAAVKQLADDLKSHPHTEKSINEVRELLKQVPGTRATPAQMSGASGLIEQERRLHSMSAETVNAAEAFNQSNRDALVAKLQRMIPEEGISGRSAIGQVVKQLDDEQVALFNQMDEAKLAKIAAQSQAKAAKEAAGLRYDTAARELAEGLPTVNAEDTGKALMEIRKSEKETADNAMSLLFRAPEEAAVGREYDPADIYTAAKKKLSDPDLQYSPENEPEILKLLRPKKVKGEVGEEDFSAFMEEQFARSGAKVAPAARAVEKDLSLADFIRREGGIDEAGLKGETKRFSIKEGYGLINRKTGKSLDRLREAAEEAGYLPQGSTPDDLMNALERDVLAKKAGKPGGVFSSSRQNWDDLFTEPIDQEIPNALAYTDIKAMREAVGQDIARELTRGTSEARKRVRALREIMEVIDDTILSGDPKVAELYYKAVSAYRDDYARRFLKGVNLKSSLVDGYGVPRIPPEKLAANYFKPVHGALPAQAFIDLYGMHPRAVREFENSILNRYRLEVVRNGVIDPKAHEKFMSQKGYAAALDKLAGAGINTKGKIANMGNAAETLAKQRAAELAKIDAGEVAAVEAAVSKLQGAAGKMKDLKGSPLAKVLGAGSSDAIMDAALKDPRGMVSLMAKMNPVQRKAFATQVMKRIDKDLRYSDPDRAGIDPNKLMGFLTDNEKSIRIAFRFGFGGTAGKEHYDSLKAIARLGQVFERTDGPLRVGGQGKLGKDMMQEAIGVSRPTAFAQARAVITGRTSPELSVLTLSGQSAAWILGKHFAEIERQMLFDPKTSADILAILKAPKPTMQTAAKMKSVLARTKTVFNRFMAKGEIGSRLREMGPRAGVEERFNEEDNQ